MCLALCSASGSKAELDSSKAPLLVFANQTISGLDGLSHEESLQCMVCREGYGFKPREMLGIYVYNRAKDHHLSNTVTTVTHFNLIHFSCHADAARADRRLRPPKNEWDGATLRNSHTYVCVVGWGWGWV